MAGGSSDEGRGLRDCRGYHPGDRGRNSWRMAVRNAAHFDGRRIDWRDYRGVRGSGDSGVDHAINKKNLTGKPREIISTRNKLWAKSKPHRPAGGRQTSAACVGGESQFAAADSSPAPHN